MNEICQLNRRFRCWGLIILSYREVIYKDGFKGVFKLYERAVRLPVLTVSRYVPRPLPGPFLCRCSASGMKKISISFSSRRCLESIRRGVLL